MNKKIEIGLNHLNTKFGELKPVLINDKVYYLDNNRETIFFYYRRSSCLRCYINYERIWKFFEKILQMEYNEIMELVRVWIHKTYGLKGLTPECSFIHWLINKLN
jgi:hypothetical protein